VKPTGAPYRKQPVDLNKLDVDSKPLLTEADLTAYNWQAHAFWLTDAAETRLTNFIESYGTRYFVVVAEGQRCYLLTSLGMASSSFPPPDMPRMMEERTFRIPGKEIEIWIGARDLQTDPRADPRIKKALRAAGIPERQEDSGEFASRIAALRSADVSNDVNTAVAKGDLRFFVDSHTKRIVVLGDLRGSDRMDELTQKYGTRQHAGSGGATSSQEHRFERLALQYGEAYNRLLWSKIKERESAITNKPDAGDGK